MHIGQVIHFHDERFFDGAVQLSWVQKRIDQARQAAGAFVFHGPRYHGGGEAEGEGIESSYRLKDSASFVRDLLDSLRAGLEGRDANPYWLVVAGYGSGKSHLALTCAILLSEPASETARQILDHIDRADSQVGAEVRQQVQALANPVLVLPLDGMAGFHLGNALSRAVFAQLRRHGVDADAIRDLSPRFQTAEQFVARNFAGRADGFAERLPGLSATQICERLRDNDEAVYAEVDALYAEANGRPIPVEGQESAQELIETLCSVYCGPDGPFSHVVILFDEFGRYLEYAAEKPQLAGDSALQQIFQGVQDNSAKVRFLGFIQYELKTYLKRFGGADLRQLQRYVTRFDAANKWYLSTNLETIFAHMIGKDEAALTQIWQQTGADHQCRLSWERMSQSVPGFGRSPVWREPERFAQIIARGCWPLHPLAVWFLTRQSDVVQSRSALTFIKDVVERVATEDVQVDGRLRQVSAADLVLRSMLPELIATEHETGSTVAETLQMLLEKFRGHLDGHQQLALAGVSILLKMRIGKQTREAFDSLLCEATVLHSGSLKQALEMLSGELGALEWNSDLGQYELIADSTTRGVFQQWLRRQQAAFTADGIRELFVRRGAADAELGDVPTDFGVSRRISTSDWTFEARLAHAHTCENAIRSAFREWQQAILPKDVKGKVIYLYLHPDDDFGTVGERVQACLEAELRRIGQPMAPIWVIGIMDWRGTLAEHIGRLHLFDEQMSDSDRERFRRFVPEDRERSRQALKDGVQEAIKNRRYWIAGFAEAPAGRLRIVGQEIFAQVYSKVLPFPFDGFASAAGGGAADAAQLTRALIARQFSGNWVATQPRRLQNRVDDLLFKSWKALMPSGRLAEPNEPHVRDLFQWLEQAHREDLQRTLLISYRTMVAPPYGLNASSAGLLLGLLLAVDNPPRRIEQSGEMVGSADWVNHAFPSQRSRHYLDEEVLAHSRLRFLSEDSAARWRTLFNRWETEENYSRKVALLREADKLREVDPLPETLEGNYKYLRDQSNKAAAELLEVQNKITDWERGIEKAAREGSAYHAIKLGALLLHQCDEMQDNPKWPQDYIRECDTLLVLAREQIAREVGNWILRQSCNSVMQVNEFRQRMEQTAKYLADLGFAREAQALTQQTQHSIYQVEQRQQFSLTLAQSDDYPRQPDPKESTPVRLLRDEIAEGDMLIASVQEAHTVLSNAEIAARVSAIQRRQEKLRAARSRQETALGALYAVQLDSEEGLRQALAKADGLRKVFVETPNENSVSELVVQLERILADVRSWEFGDATPERLEELLTRQVEHQLTDLDAFLKEKEIDPAWDMTAIYSSLVRERVQMARRRSAEWVRPRVALLEQVRALDRQRCQAIERELVAAPAFLSAEDHGYVEQLLDLVRQRREELDEQERRATVARWQKRYLELGDADRLGRHETEQLLLELRNPPCALRQEELALVVPIAARLTARLDQLSMDELVARIRQLSKEQQSQLLSLLSTLLRIENASV